MGIYLADTGALLSGIASMALAITAGVTAFFGVRTYRQNTQESHKQAREATGRWLKELQQRFTDDKSFRAIRRELYAGQGSELVKALGRKHAFQAAPDTAQVPTTQEWELLVALDDYLDFFALLERLIRSRQLEADDAYMLFSWYALSGLAVPDVEAEIELNFHWVRDLRARFRAMQEKR